MFSAVPANNLINVWNIAKIQLYEVIQSNLRFEKDKIT